MTNRKKKMIVRMAVLCACLLLFVFLIFQLFKGFAVNLQPVFSANKDDNLQLTMHSLKSPNAILVRLDDGEVLAERKGEGKIYPASLTKLMTVYVSLNRVHDVNNTVILTDEAFAGLSQQNASKAGFSNSEEVRVIDLMYGAILPSGAECCQALAKTFGGSEAGFVQLMNDTAQHLGMKNTHFTNSTGLHDEDHYTTVQDLAILLQAALKNETFREILTTKNYTTAPTEKHPGGLSFQSTLFSDKDVLTVKNAEVLGGKTGYTKEAGLCLASLCKKGDCEFVLVTASAQGSQSTEQYHFSDAVSVYSAIPSSKAK